MAAVLHGIRRSRSCGVVRTARRTASIVAAGVRSDPSSSNSPMACSKARSSSFMPAVPRGACLGLGTPRRRPEARALRSGVAIAPCRPGCRASRPPPRGACPRGDRGRRRPAGRAEAGGRPAPARRGRRSIGYRPRRSPDRSGGRARSMPSAGCAGIRVAGVDEDPVGPRLEAVGLPQMRQLPPHGHERVLQNVLGEAGIAQDAPSDPEQRVADLVHQIRECRLVARARPLDEVSVHGSPAIGRGRDDRGLSSMRVGPGDRSRRETPPWHRSRASVSVTSRPRTGTRSRHRRRPSVDRRSRRARRR